MLEAPVSMTRRRSVPRRGTPSSSEATPSLVCHDPDGHVHTRRIALPRKGVEVVPSIAWRAPCYRWTAPPSRRRTPWWIPGAHWTWKLWRALDRHTADIDSPSSGDLEADAWDLLQSLYEKIREEMPICHVERATHGWQVRPERRLVGRIE